MARIGSAKWVAMVLLSALAALVVACGEQDDSVTAAGCAGSVQSGIAPGGSGSDAYTILLRVNTEEEVSQLADDALRSRLLDRDLFVINTEYKRMTPGQAEKIFNKIREEFPCNRIASLNGLVRGPGRPGYINALADQPELHSVILDWEPSTWSGAGKGPWSDKSAVNVRRIGSEAGSVAEKIRKGPGAPGTRVAVATQFRPNWDYAAFARRLALVNWKLSPDLRGYQLIQSQDRCRGTAKTAPLQKMAERMVSQYRPLSDGAPGPNGWQQNSRSGEDMLQHLGFEISFSSDPKQGDTLPADRDSIADAAACTAAILDAGGSAFIYWATPEAVKSLLNTKEGRSLRPVGQS